MICRVRFQIVASLLLFMEEEDAFWLMCTIIEDLLPASYYSSTLLGVQADQRVLRQLLPNYVPEVDRILREHDIGELAGIFGSFEWFKLNKNEFTNGCKTFQQLSLKGEREEKRKKFYNDDSDEKVVSYKYSKTCQ